MPAKQPTAKRPATRTPATGGGGDGPAADFMQPPIKVDLTAATAMATGHRQREWLMLLLSPGVGLQPADWTTRRGRSVDEFVDRLARAGYRIVDVEVGHRPKHRRLITGFSSANGYAYRIWSALRNARTGYLPSQDAFVEALSLRQLELAESLATDPTSRLNAAQLIAAAQRLA